MDLSLIQRCQAGNEEAFAALFDNYKNLVFQTAYLMLDNAASAEDVLQDVFILVYRSMAGYDPAKGSFGAWLHRITINQCLNWRRRPFYSTRSLEEIPENALCGPALSEEQLAEIGVIRQALTKLSPKQRSIIILRYYWDFSYAEMAEILGVPLGTIKSRLNLAMQSLHTGLERGNETASSPLTEEIK